jgi:hypothetical protein
MLTVFSQQTRKVLSWMVVGRRFDVKDRRFCAVSQNMEVHALNLVIPELMAVGKITGYVHDNDAKAKKAITLSKWGIIEKIDPGHAFKSFDRKLGKFNDAHGKVFAEIEDRLRSLLKDLMYLQGVTQVEKVAYWRNAERHFAGVHAGCPFQHDTHRPPKVWSRASDPLTAEASLKLLKEFLSKTESVVDHVDGEFSTQMNESINRSKIKFADKDRQWRTTWVARMACAVLDRNVANWRLTLYDRLNLPPLSGDSRLFLEIRERDRLWRKAWVTSNEYKMQRRALRKATKEAKKQAPKNAKTDYKPNPWVPRK